MSELKIFENEQFGKVRTLEEDGIVLLCGSDCAKALGYTNPSKALNDHCKGVTKCYTPTKGGRQEMSFIPESDLYRLIVNSKLPAAAKFERWVFEEVLPSIRKDGGYIAGQETLSDEELLAKALKIAERKILERDRKIAEQTNRIEEMRPKEIFADAVSESKNSILIREMAKFLRQNSIPIGQNRLYAWLREHNYLIKQRGLDYNLPTQKSMEMGLFTIHERMATKNNGDYVFCRTTRVTGKGQQYFVNKFLKLKEQGEI